MSWNPDQYERFRNERARPFHDLLALVRPRPGMRVIDLGCGTGELTRLAHQQLGAHETLGIDASPEMLARSAEYAVDGLRFAQGDLRTAAVPGPWDLILSNAAIHWVEDHDALFARLREALAPEGQIAVQVPASFDHPSHAVAREVAAEEPFASALRHDRPDPGTLAPERYGVLLYRLGFGDLHVRLQVYLHPLESRESVVEWMKGSLLTHYEARLPAHLFPAFLARYRERLAAALPDERPFLYPFKRILIWGALAQARAPLQTATGMV